MTTMELMRHSERNLTDKLYTDSNLLPTGEVIRNLPGDKQLIEILTEISGKTGLYGSNSVEITSVKMEPKNRLEPAFLQGLIKKRVFETLVEMAGIEPDTPCAKTSVSIKGSEFPTEAFTEILTEIYETDRQILARIVERWGNLSEELKKAVWAITHIS